MRSTGIVASVLFLFVIAGTQPGCGSGGSSKGSSTPQDDSLDPKALAEALRIIDIRDAQGIMLTGERANSSENLSARASTGGGKELFPAGEVQPRGFVGTPHARAVTESFSLEENSVYRVAGDGRLVRVPLQDAEGNELNRNAIIPWAVFDVAPDFVMMQFLVPGSGECGPEPCATWGYSYSPSDIRSYLVQKSTGSAFHAEQSAGQFIFNLNSFNHSERTLNDNTIERDQNNRLYFRFQGNELFVINTVSSADGSLQGTSIQTGLEQIDYFYVDPQGDFIYYEGFLFGFTEVANPDPVIRFLSLSGGDPVQTPLVEGTILVDREGLLYNVELTEQFFQVNRLSSQGNAPHIESAGDYTYTFTLDRNDALDWCETAPGSHLFCGGTEWNPRNFLLSLSGRGDIVAGRIMHGHVEFDPVNSQFVFHGTPFEMLDCGSCNNLRVVLSENYIWYYLADKVVRYQPRTRVATDIALDSDLLISQLNIQSGDTVLAEGVRFSDGAKVQMTVAPLSNTVEVISESDPFQPTIISLSPITPADFIVIDGTPTGWSIGSRMVHMSGSPLDPSDGGNDLRYYSQLIANGRYYGLVEFASSNIAVENWTVISISQTHLIEIKSDEAWVRVIDSDQRIPLEKAGGITATSEAVEFYISLQALDTNTPTADRVVRVSDDSGQPAIGVNPLDIMMP